MSGIDKLYDDNWRLKLLVNLWVSFNFIPSRFKRRPNDHSIMIRADNRYLWEESQPSADAFAPDFSMAKDTLLVADIFHPRPAGPHETFLLILCPRTFHLSLALPHCPPFSLTCRSSICVMMQNFISSPPINAISNPFCPRGLEFLDGSLMQTRDL
ncbi:hypothetical protein F1880_001498 [Penicillium rolfsii]|nr:hypothetical protein F1880_001498 [Penicillium rolfsii]